MGVHSSTKHWVTCDKCERRKDTKSDLLPPKWALIHAEIAPDEYPDDIEMVRLGRSELKWDDIIKLTIKTVLCEECLADWNYFTRRMRNIRRDSKNESS